MNEEARKILCEMIEHYGRGLCNDSRRCSALLKDHCGQYKREIFALISALEHGVTENLINAPSGTPSTILIPRLSKQLEDELGLAENVAKWAVETWALALKRISHPIAQTKTSVAQNTSDNSAILTSTQQFAQIQANTNPGGQLKFPKFSVGEVTIGQQKLLAVGEINVPKNQSVALKIATDVNDFSFFESCDSNRIITEIDLSNSKAFNASCFKYLINMKNLKSLDCSFSGDLLDDSRYRSFSGISEESKKGYKTLYSLLYLSDLKLRNRDVYNAISLISGIKSLRSLDLDMQANYSNFISDSEIENLSKNKNLRFLNLAGCKELTGPGVLTHLGDMTQLEYLNLTGCSKIEKNRLQELKAMLPNTTIVA